MGEEEGERERERGRGREEEGEREGERLRDRKRDRERDKGRERGTPSSCQSHRSKRTEEMSSDGAYYTRYRSGRICKWDMERGGGKEGKTRPHLGRGGVLDQWGYS